MLFRIFARVGFTVLVCSRCTAAFSQQRHVENSPPKVTITTPASNSTFQWNSIIPYVISVSDHEDGNSQYNEIPNNEVLLMVTYLPDSSQVQKYLLDRSKADLGPLMWMSTSTCFNCHATKTKLIGPSFERIAQRYAQTGSADSLATKMITGSTGIWGDLKMPPNPDLKIDQAREIVRWILKYNTNPDQNYIAGIEGAFRTKEKPNKGSGKGVYVLTASYTDHGVPGSPSDPTVRKSRKPGQHTVILKSNE